MAPLALACRANPKLKVSVVIDERSAGFFALGLSSVTQKPTILICTSGSAVGQFYPAVMEANYGMIPLIVITADRAPENQDRSSAQAIDQIRAFGQHVRASHNIQLPDASIDSLSPLVSRIYEQATGATPGPVHVNQAFRDPLVAKLRNKRPVPTPPVVSNPVLTVNADHARRLAESLAGRRGVIVCGASEKICRAVRSHVGALRATMKFTAASSATKASSRPTDDEKKKVDRSAAVPVPRAVKAQITSSTTPVTNLPMSHHHEVVENSVIADVQTSSTPMAPAMLPSDFFMSTSGLRGSGA